MKFLLSHVIICATVVALFSATGCNTSEFPVAQVSGTIKLDGNPLPNARVTFNPRAAGGSLRAGPDSYGKTDANGQFVLETIEGFEGAVVGTHLVKIRTGGEAEGPDGKVIVTKEKLPARYNHESEITFEVPSGGTQSADFELTSD